MQQDWPGKNVVERLALLTGDDEVVTEADVDDALPRVKAVKSESSRGRWDRPPIRRRGRRLASVGPGARENADTQPRENADTRPTVGCCADGRRDRARRITTGACANGARYVRGNDGQS
jgi:hypothetical protein